MLCKTGTPIISTGKKCTASKLRHFQCIPLANMPEKHLLRIVLSKFLRLSCLFHWCDNFGNCAWLSVQLDIRANGGPNQDFGKTEDYGFLSVKNLKT